MYHIIINNHKNGIHQFSILSKKINKMKKTIPILLFAVIAAGANAQTTADALRFSENNYYGTARTISMGNAFTALGGDLGSIGINPAGSAVNNYSQATLTPNISIITSKATYDAMPGMAGSSLMENKNSKVRFSVPNFGFTMNIKTNSGNALKAITLGLVANASANYLDDLSAGGRNTATSYAGYLATNMKGLNSSMLNGENAYYDVNCPWNQITGWQSGMVSTFGGFNNQYVGVTEKTIERGYDASGNKQYDIQLADAIDQIYGKRAHGIKYDVLLNLGMNFSDRFFAGVNLGITSMDYSMNEYFKEFAVDPNNFELEFDNGAGGTSITYFNSLRYRYAYSAEGTGIYAKFGFLAVPVSGLRLGVAIQTPTANFITEHWQHAGETFYENSSFDATATSPKGEFKYKLVSPFRANFGIAYTFADLGVISADYELCNYSTMKFKETETNDNTAFNGVNKDIKDFTGSAHNFRLGIEVKPIPFIAVRAGYNLTTSPERYYDAAGTKLTPKAFKNSFAFGLGYSTENSFFCDVAVRDTFLPKEYIYPYDTYIEGVLSPELAVRRSLWDVVVTLGWRF